MSSSDTTLDQITANMVQQDVVANANFAAASPAMGYGRQQSTTAALTWGYNEAVIDVSGVPTLIAEGTIALTASATNYLYRTSAGVVTKVTSPPAGWRTSGGITSPAGAQHLYQIVTGADTVTSYEDLRTGGMGPPGAAGATGPIWTAPSVGTVTYHATNAVPHNTYDIVDMTLTGPLTLTFSGGVDGKVCRVRFRQDGTGSRVLTLGSNIRVGTDITAVTLSTTASKLDYVAFQYNATDSKYDLISFVRGF